MTEKTINQLQDEIIEEFEGFDDWMDRYAYIIELGNAMPELDEQYKTPDNLIDGCQSRVWLQADYEDGLAPTATRSSSRASSRWWCESSAATPPRRSLTLTSTSSKPLACATISRPHAATACWPWSSMPAPMHWPTRHLNRLKTKLNHNKKL